MVCIFATAMDGRRAAPPGYNALPLKPPLRRRNNGERSSSSRRCCRMEKLQNMMMILLMLLVSQKVVTAANSISNTHTHTHSFLNGRYNATSDIQNILNFSMDIALLTEVAAKSDDSSNSVRSAEILNIYRNVSFDPSS